MPCLRRIRYILLNIFSQKYIVWVNCLSIYSFLNTIKSSPDLILNRLVDTFRDFSYSFYSDNDPRKIQVYTNIDLYFEYFDQYLNKEIAKKWLSDYCKLYIQYMKDHS
jgi:hypothetical protein